MDMVMDMSNLTLITLAWGLYQQGVPKARIAGRLGRHQETIHLWLCGIQREGLKRQVNPVVKRGVRAIRKRESGCCGQKIAYFLEQCTGCICPCPRSTRFSGRGTSSAPSGRNVVGGEPVPVASGPSQVVQMDTVMFGSLFAFTAIAIYTKEADILVAPALTAAYGCAFLEQAMARRFNGWVELIQTDGGSEFKESFAHRVQTYCQRHRVAQPYKKNEQEYIESFNRTMRKECQGWLHDRREDLSREDISECQQNSEEFLHPYHYHRLT